MAYVTRREGCPLGEVETWVFDLDNTLYPASSRLFERVQVRMNEYICTRLDVTMEDAIALRRKYFLEHGTTMHGLMAVNRVDPHEFMAFVHDVDLSAVPANPELILALEGLSGRKLVYTNGSVPHAENLLKHLGITHCFEDIFDIVASEFAPKPAMAAPFRAFVTRYGIQPTRALMLEDMAKNLAPAAELGMTTAWVRTDVDWAAIASDADHIHHVVEDLAGFLTAALARAGAGDAEGRAMSVADAMQRKLTERFAPVRLDIVDDSHRHAGHAGAGPGGETHFSVTLVSEAFRGIGRVARQRLVYETLEAEIAGGVHALALTTITPEEDRGS